EALLAQPIDGGLDVAVRFGQRVLAIHHARASLLAQLLDQPSGDRSHRIPSRSLEPAPRTAARRFSSAARSARTPCAQAEPFEPPDDRTLTRRPSARAPARSTCRG